MTEDRGFPPDYTLEAESPRDHIRNALQLLGNLRHVLSYPLKDSRQLVPDVDAARARLRKALQQLESHAD